MHTKLPGPTMRDREMTAAIAVAYFTNHHLDADEVPDLVRSIAETIADLQDDTARARHNGIEPIAALNPRHTVFKGHIVCMICRKTFAMLKTHLTRVHDIQPDAYRNKFDLPSNYPMVASDYAARRSAIAKEFGLGRNGRGRPASAKDKRHNK